MLVNFRSLLVLASLASSTLAAAVAAGCNGDTRLCGRKYSNVTQIGAHNSAFVGELPTQNQGLEVEGQLDMGIRFLQAQVKAAPLTTSSGAHPLQTHKFLGELFMCHTSCFLLNTGLLVDYLTRINAWMVAHPNEVVTLLLTNQDKVDVSVFGKAMADSGLAKLAYTPPKKIALNEWPTLQEMIKSNKRLVVSLDYHADTAKVPYILDEFAYSFETPFSQTDPNFAQCKVDRPPNASSAGRFAIVNHVLDIAIGDGVLIPAILEVEKTNSVASIMAQVGLCQKAHGTTPNFILVDYAERGEVIKAQNILNHLA
ncbi:hypothetical protein V494_07580 [Pseudogymnoascus sp. VKM F-4513 (FW-928)]|nr:hypothetical protein V494_07580 [Pseudogymnoascus sp. VKM F-4513 (FW-928)]